MRLLASAELPREEQRHAPRFFINCEAQVAADGKVDEANILDISEGGLKLETASAMVGAPVVVVLAGLSDVRGHVVWSQGGQVGVAFEERLCFETLSRWYAEHRLMGRLTSALVGPLLAMLASPATAAEPTHASVQTSASVEIVDPVGVSVEAKLDKNGALVGTATARSSSTTDVIVSTMIIKSSESQPASGSGGAIFQYN
jgi:hypothetical protein